VACSLIVGHGIAAAQENIFPKMIGKWRELTSATTVIVESDGKVYSAGSTIYGTVERSVEGGGNFAFENENTRCVYDILFLGPPLLGAASWGLRSEKKPGSCFKTGTFVKAADAEKQAAEGAQMAPAPPPTQIAKDVAEARQSATPTSPYEGPEELENINVVYFRRAQDEGKVDDSLAEERVAYTTRSSNFNIPSNVITCTPDVPVAAIKRLAGIMLDADVPIRAILPSIHPEFPKRLTIESHVGDVSRRAVMDSSDLENITSCNFENKGRIWIKNSCTEQINLTLRYRDKTGLWRMATGYSFDPDESSFLTNDGEDVATNDAAFYFYARGKTLVWQGKDQNTDDRSYVIGDRSYRFRYYPVKKDSEGDWQLRLCD
jgi:hypothetical protein